MEIEEQYDKVYRYCYFKLHHKQMAEDITQEAFLHYFSKKHPVGKADTLPYLYTIARNLCIDEYRRKQTISLEEIEEPASEDSSERVIESVTVHQMLSAIPEDGQELLLLRYVNELPLATISKITGMSRFAVYRKLTKLVKQLRQKTEE